jgi:Zn finger protein HypA/HybF involved in hydrogenase expression
MPKDQVPIDQAYWWCELCSGYCKVYLGKGEVFCQKCNSKLAAFRVKDPRQLVIEL